MVKNKCKVDPREWHRWFAWYPVCFDAYPHNGRICWKRAWWCYIERRKSYGTYDNSVYYREIIE